MHDKNSYAAASLAYGSALAETSPRALESQLLLKSATQLENLANRLRGGEEVSVQEIGSVLEFNQKLWTVFVGDTMDKEHPLPQEIKNNIASLGVFIFTRTRDLMIDCSAPERLKILIDINRNIASGLMKSAANSAAMAQASQQQAAAQTPATPASSASAGAAPARQDLTDSYA